jgi:hypothetical protein
MPREIYLDKEIPPLTLKVKKPGLNKVFERLMNEPFDFSKSKFNQLYMQSFLMKREFIQEPFLIRHSKMPVTYQGEVLGGSTPFGRGIMIQDDDDVLIY